MNIKTSFLLLALSFSAISLYGMQQPQLIEACFGSPVLGEDQQARIDKEIVSDLLSLCTNPEATVDEKYKAIFPLLQDFQVFEHAYYRGKSLKYYAEQKDFKAIAEWAGKWILQRYKDKKKYICDMCDYSICSLKKFKQHLVWNKHADGSLYKWLEPQVQAWVDPKTKRYSYGYMKRGFAK